MLGWKVRTQPISPLMAYCCLGTLSVSYTSLSVQPADQHAVPRHGGLQGGVPSLSQLCLTKSGHGHTQVDGACLW